MEGVGGGLSNIRQMWRPKMKEAHAMLERAEAQRAQLAAQM